MYLKWSLKPKTFVQTTIGGSNVLLWVTFIIDYYMNALCLFFLSYWIHLLLICLHEWNFPEFVLFSNIIYGLHGINEKTLPRKNHLVCSLFSFYRISPCLICYLTVVKWVLYVALYLLYNEVPSAQCCRIYEEYVIFALYNFVQCSFLLTNNHAS